MNKKGFVVSAVLYPLLVLFLALIMGLISMSDTRKRILDKMKLEITDSIFDEATCSCDTILNKLNYIINNGVGGSGGGGTYAYNKLSLNVNAYETASDIPIVGNIIGDIAVITDTPIVNYYVSTTVPTNYKEGTIWIVQDITSEYYVSSDWNKIGISYVMQYENETWVLKKAYVYSGSEWQLLYYVSLQNGYVDLTSTDVNAQIVHTYDYTGEYQTFTPVFSGYYKIELWGAQGGTVETTYGLGGYGSYTSGEIYLNAGENLYVYVGGSGGKATGGWNGGGVSSIYSSTSYGGNGGGATDVRVVATLVKSGWSDSESLRSRIMVAAGGGGGYYYFGSNTSSWQSYSTSSGGSGGGLSGYDGMKLYYPDRLSSSVNEYGTGGTQIAGGYQSTNPTNYVGGFGFGSNSGMATGGGGSGYYGGGSGDNTNGGGGGGSSYVSGHAGCIAVTSDGTPKVSTYSTLEDSIHYTGYKFINTEMIDGSGYSWTTTKASSTKGMPTHDGTSTITGNAGNGYAKITLLTVEVKTE